MSAGVQWGFGFRCLNHPLPALNPTATMAGIWIQVNPRLTVEITPIHVAAGAIGVATRQQSKLSAVADLGVNIGVYVDRQQDLRCSCREWAKRCDANLFQDIEVALEWMENEGLYGLQLVHDRLVVRMQTPISRAWCPNTWNQKWRDEAPADETPDPYDGMVLVDARGLVAVSVNVVTVLTVFSSIGV